VPTADEVYDLVASFIGDGRLPSADAIVARLGGSKTRVLALRDEAYARLRAEGKPTDPIAGLQSAAEPMLRKVLELATLRIEKEYASEIALLRAQIQTLNADVAQAFGAEERASKAEEQHARLAASYEELNEVFARQSETMLVDRERATIAEQQAIAAEQQLASMTRTYEDLVEAFGSLAAGIKPTAKAVAPSDRELEAVLRAGRFDDYPPTKNDICRRMRATDSSWSNPVAQLALSRVMAAGYLAVETVGLTKKGNAWFDKNGRDLPEAYLDDPEEPEGVDD